MLRTNRDLYLFAIGLTSTRAPLRPLEEYLRALWRLAALHRASSAISLSAFGNMLQLAMTADAPPFDSAWTAFEPANGEGYACWESTIAYQIVDLHQMAETGVAPDYFGVDAPRGGRWYNFTPEAFLECGVRGCFGGWEEGDPSGVVLVRGNVAILDEAGRITDADPSDLDRPIYEIESIDWNRFADFLGCGQCYEQLARERQRG
jgi:hypothetical protein